MVRMHDSCVVTCGLREKSMIKAKIASNRVFLLYRRQSLRSPTGNNYVE